MASRSRQWLDYAVLRLLTRAAGRLPRRRLLAFGRSLGGWVWRTGTYRREVVLDNLGQAFPEWDTEQLAATAQAFYRNLGQTLVEFLAMGRLDADQVRDLVRIEGEEHIRTVAADGRGALLVSGHFGNWELMGARVGALGHQVSFVVKTQSNARVDRLQNDIRRRAGVGIIRTGASIKEMMKALRRGDLVALVADQDAGTEGHFTDFLGREASVFKGTAYFAWKLRVPIVTGFIYRQADGRHLLVIDPPFEAEPGWDEETAVARLTARHVQRLETAVRRAPDHYFWVHRRWKTRPPKELP